VGRERKRECVVEIGGESLEEEKSFYKGFLFTSLRYFIVHSREERQEKVE